MPHARPVRAHARPRRTQAERRASMRKRLLDETVDRLAAVGYARMSTNDIVRRAGVSRGALVHHFPTKASLALAALERWLDARLDEFDAAFTALPPEQRRADVAIDVLWEMFQGATFAAWLELTVAARTDPEVLAGMRGVEQRFHERVDEEFRRAFPGALENPAFDPTIAVRFAFSVLFGAAVQRLLEPRGAPDPPDAVTTLKFLAAAIVNEPWRSDQ